MIFRFLTIIMFSTMLLAQDDIDTIVENINNAPIKERYVLMNQLKQLLKNKNKEFRKTIIKKLQTASINNKDINQNAFNNIKMNPNKIINNINLNPNINPTSISSMPTQGINSTPEIKPKQRSYRPKISK